MIYIYLWMWHYYIGKIWKQYSRESTSFKVGVFSVGKKKLIFIFSLKMQKVIHQSFVFMALPPTGNCGEFWLFSSSKSLLEAPHCRYQQLVKPLLYDPTLLYYFYPRYWHKPTPTHPALREQWKGKNPAHFFHYPQPSPWGGGGPWLQMTST